MKWFCLSFILLIGCTSQESVDSKKPVKYHKPATPTLTKSGDISKGKALYVSKACASCHQMDGMGMKGALGADFVNDTIVLSKTDEVLLDSIKNGIMKNGKYMPPQKKILKDQEMIDVLAYIRSAFTKKN
ncbi:MAG: cytochrome c [Candidatus Cloacimonetes bacterium]|nr:cytochrome c [Candidatus Cloacimonadota bacterium]